MNEERLHHALVRLASHASRVDVAEALCATAVEIVAVDGAGISIHIPSGMQYSLGAVGEDMEHIHELERTLGEGPCIDAYRTGLPTAESDLESGDSWPAFRSEALRTHARALFGFPMHVDAECFGALNLYNTRPGPLADDQHEDALLMADLSSYTVVASLADGTIANVENIDDAFRGGDQVHQATGIIAEQLRIPIVNALARLRGRAFADQRAVADVAKDIVEGRLRLEE